MQLAIHYYVFTAKIYVKNHVCRRHHQLLICFAVTFALGLGNPLPPYISWFSINNLILYRILTANTRQHYLTNDPVTAFLLLIFLRFAFINKAYGLAASVERRGAAAVIVVQMYLHQRTSRFSFSSLMHTSLKGRRFSVPISLQYVVNKKSWRNITGSAGVKCWFWK